MSAQPFSVRVPDATKHHLGIESRTGLQGDSHFTTGLQPVGCPVRRVGHENWPNGVRRSSGSSSYTMVGKLCEPAIDDVNNERHMRLTVGTRWAQAARNGASPSFRQVRFEPCAEGFRCGPRSDPALQLKDRLHQVSGTGCVFRTAQAARSQSQPCRDVVNVHRSGVCNWDCSCLPSVTGFRWHRDVRVAHSP